MTNLHLLVVVFLTVLAVSVAVAPAVEPAVAMQGDIVDVWLGTGSGKLSKGIYHCTLNKANGKLSDPNPVADISGPGFLAMHPKLPRLYAVGSLDGKPCVAAYAINGKLENASLEFLNTLEIGDGGAAHVSEHFSLGGGK